MQRVPPGRTTLCDVVDAALIEHTVSFNFTSWNWLLHCFSNFQLAIGTQRLTFRFAEQIYGGPIDGGIVTDDDDFFVPLETSIQRTLGRCGRAIILADEKWFCVRQVSSGAYALFNSHPCTTGNVSDFDGVARTFIVPTIAEIVGLFKAGISGAVNMYGSLYGVEIDLNSSQ